MEIKIILLVFLIFCIKNTELIACRCEDPGTVKESFDNTTLLIYGEIISFDYVSIEETMNPEKTKKIRNQLDKSKLLQFESEFIIRVDVRIKNQYKGNVINDVTTIFTTRTGASCGFRDFKVGEEFIIYAYRNAGFYYYNYASSSDIKKGLGKDGTYWTNHCARTKSGNKAELKELDSICDQ